MRAKGRPHRACRRIVALAVIADGIGRALGLRREWGLMRADPYLPPCSNPYKTISRKCGS